MQRTNQKAPATLALVLILALAGCAAKNTTLTIPQQIRLNVDKTLAAIQSLNEGVATSFIELDRQNLIPKTVTREVLAYCRDAAVAAKEAVAIQQSSDTPEQKAAKILTLFNRLQTIPGTVKAFAGQTGPTLIAVAKNVTSLILLVQSFQQPAVSHVAGGA